MRCIAFWRSPLHVWIVISLNISIEFAIFHVGQRHRWGYNWHHADKFLMPRSYRGLPTYHKGVLHCGGTLHSSKQHHHSWDAWMTNARGPDLTQPVWHAEDKKEKCAWIFFFHGFKWTRFSFSWRPIVATCKFCLFFMFFQYVFMYFGIKIKLHNCL